MVLQHVAHGARFVVVVAAAFHAHGFTHRDLHLFDMPRAPQRFEQGIAEAQRNEVLHAFLAKVMVGAKDALLIKRLGHGIVDGDGAGQILADRFFQHHAGACACGSVRGQCLAGRTIEFRCGAHVIEHIAVAQGIHPGCQRRHRGIVIGTGRAVIQTLQQAAQGSLIVFSRGDAIPDAVGH